MYKRQKIHNLKQAAKTLNVYQQYGFTSPEQSEAAVDIVRRRTFEVSLKKIIIALLGVPRFEDFRIGPYDAFEFEPYGVVITYLMIPNS